MDPFKETTMPDLMNRKREVYKTLAQPVESDASEVNHLCAQVELDAINREISSR